MISVKFKKWAGPYVYSFVRIVGKLSTDFKSIIYRIKSGKNTPINLTFRKNRISIFPRGQIAELSYTSKFESDLLSIYTQYLKPGMNIIDVGANIGLYTLIASNVIGTAGRVWSFEPAKDIYKLLRNNIKLNSLKNVTTNNIAIAEKTGTLRLVLEENQLDGYRYIERTNTHQRLQETYPVRVITIDNYFSNILNNIDYIKIDVEGGEFDVLSGAQKTIGRSKNIIIQLENSKLGLSRSGHTQSELFKLLKTLNLVPVSWDNSNKTWEINNSKVKKSGNIWACKKESLSKLLAIKV